MLKKHKQACKEQAQRMRHLWKDPQWRKRWLQRRAEQNETFKVSRLKALQSLERRARISAAVAGLKLPLKALRKMRHTKREQWKDPAYRKRMRAFQLTSNTPIEQLVAKELRRFGIKFRRQYHIPGCAGTPDFVLVEAKRVLECDGVYWHSKPEVMKRDRRHNREYRKAGYAVSRLSCKVIKSRRLSKHLRRLLNVN
jgi:G:T-mismatch repair DNA endonuclease (very short patch repair protein)